MTFNFITACNTIYNAATNKSKYYAKMLKETMSGFGIKNSKLIYIFVSRSYIDLKEIKEAYQSLNDKSLAADVNRFDSFSISKVHSIYIEKKHIYLIKIF